MKILKKAIRCQRKLNNLTNAISKNLHVSKDKASDLVDYYSNNR